MTQSKLFLFGLVNGFLFSILFLIARPFGLASFGYIFLFLMQCVVATLLVRTLGYITYLESWVVMTVWLVLLLFCSLLLTLIFSNFSSLMSLEYWVFVIGFLLATGFFHKKKHVEIRKKLASK